MILVEQEAAAPVIEVVTDRGQEWHLYLLDAQINGGGFVLVSDRLHFIDECARHESGGWVWTLAAARYEGRA